MSIATAIKYGVVCRVKDRYPFKFIANALGELTRKMDEAWVLPVETAQSIAAKFAGDGEVEAFEINLDSLKFDVGPDASFMAVQKGIRKLLGIPEPEAAPAEGTILYFKCDSKNIAWVRYDTKCRLLYVAWKREVKPGEEPAPQEVTKYVEVPPNHFANIMTAKGREAPIGKERARSEGSYIAVHVKGKYSSEKVSPEEIEVLCA